MAQGENSFQLTTLERTAESTETPVEVIRIVSFLGGNYSVSNSDNLFSVTAQLEVEEIDDGTAPEESTTLLLDQALGDMVMGTNTFEQLLFADEMDQALGDVLAGTESPEHTELISAIDLELGEILDSE